jgi:hypothetical protein
MGGVVRGSPVLGSFLPDTSGYDTLRDGRVFKIEFLSKTGKWALMMSTQLPLQIIPSPTCTAD